MKFRFRIIFNRTLNACLGICAAILLFSSDTFGQSASGDDSPVSEESQRPNPSQLRAKGAEANGYINRFPEASRILVGELPIQFVPRRQYRLKAPTHGRLELNVDAIPQQLPGDFSLGSIAEERIDKDMEILESEQKLLEIKEIPKWHIQRNSEVVRTGQSIRELEAELVFLERVRENPDKYKPLLDEQEGPSRDELDKEAEKKRKELNRLKDYLKVIASGDYERLEVGMMKKRGELKVIQMEDRQRSANLKLPFAGEVTFLVSYVADEENFVGSGEEIALVQDLSEIYAIMPILDSDWRELDRSRLRLTPQPSDPELFGSYLKAVTREIGGQSELLYYFEFPNAETSKLRRYIGGKPMAELYYELGEKMRIIPKLLLISKEPDVFREGGWEALLEKILPNTEEFFVGLNHVAVFVAKE